MEASGCFAVQCRQVSFLLVAIEYFPKFYRVAFLKLFGLLSLAGKMPRTTTSGDDAGVGSKVPSTLVDPSKGTGYTLSQKTAPAGSSKKVMPRMMGVGHWSSGSSPNSP